ncbi:MAG: amidohydrolase [Lachnospiraceae bacterium]|nr:amidohydrolase [Lachnospiraceae bacterium]
MKQLIVRAKELQEQMVVDRRALHQMPEYGFALDQTVAYVKTRLTEMNIPYQEVGDHGLVAVLGQGEHCFMLRADMDGLPVAEQTDLPFCATNGAGHLCGHDLHTSMLLGAAKLLKEREEELEGQVKLMFQPAEETGTGAKAMIAAGLLENPKVEAAAALHVQAEKPIGYMEVKPGVATSSIDTFRITIEGRGGHSSRPEEVINPLDVASYIQYLLNSAIQREVSCWEQAVLAVTQVHGGEVINAFPGTAKLGGNIRCYSNEVREYLHHRIEEVAEGVCALFHATCQVAWVQTPLIVVDEALCHMFEPTLKEVADTVAIIGKPFTGSEDFSYVSQRVPVFFGWIGAGYEGNAPLHNPGVTFDENVMWRGAAALAGIAKKWLQEQR